MVIWLTPSPSTVNVVYGYPLKAPPILAYTFNSTLKMCTTFEFFGCLTANVFLDRKACVKGKTLNLKARFPKMTF